MKKRGNTSVRRYSLFPEPLAKGLTLPVSGALKKRGFEHEALLHFWPQAAGMQIAAIARPIRLKTHKDIKRAQLIVKTSPAYRLIIAHQSEQILLRLEHYLGYRPAGRIMCV